VSIINQQEEVLAMRQRWVELLNLNEPANRQKSNTVSFIESAASKTKVHIVNISPQRISEREGFDFLPIELVIEARWVDMGNFLQQLQSRPMLMFLDDLRIEKYSDAAGSLRARLLVSRLVSIK
jgi:Tfp pilus assembly protein PilO